ncbi:MAG: efflux RND transporter periplasmic adaptor subunit [Verrucomicrobiales bacterium]|nr:efflux RND transporter periplasmic adaptor subunit [Verrucomicrobiales bacterium]
MIRALIRILLPLAIVAGGAALGWRFFNSQEAPRAMKVKPTLLRVEGETLKPTVYPVMGQSQGTVQPVARTLVTAEVGGRVVEVSSHFRPGEFFEEGEVLVKLDAGDYEAAVVAAEAALATSEAALAEEEAKAAQAVESWKALGRSGEPGPLVSRGPQLAKANAETASAQAQLEKARRDLSRTEIRAPYAGRVLQQRVDLGQVISAGMDLGEIFAVDAVEVRLPVPEREKPFLQLPRHYRGQAETAGAKVWLTADEGGKVTVWEGRLVRVEGAVDERTRQTIAVARVEEPFAPREDGAAPLKIGQFVEARIEGQKLEDVFVLPRSAVRAGNEIILITDDSRLHRVTIEPVAGDAKHLVVMAGKDREPKAGQVLCLTPIPFPAEGAKVLPTVDGQVESAGAAGGETAKKGGMGGAKSHASKES